MSQKSNGKIVYVLQVISIVPLLFFSLVVSFLTYRQVNLTISSQVEQELASEANNLITMMDLAFPGDYSLVIGDSYEIHKGDANITTAYDIVDQFKKNTGLDATLFYEDTRILSTLSNLDGSRMIGNGAPEIIRTEVLTNGASNYYHNIHLNKMEYYAYYTPLYNSDGSIIGIIFVGKPTVGVDDTVKQALLPIILSVLVVMLVISGWLSMYTRGISKVLLKIREYLLISASGNLSTELDSSVSSRNDELGDIGRSVVNMQHSIRDMIEKDALTELFNRRSGDRKLASIISKSEKTQTPFSVCIGDIDFFKKINDTYGHDCGDLVLKAVSGALRDFMLSLGFVARWGGEEFLIVFDHTALYEATDLLDILRKKIESMDIVYKEQHIKVTMTFGVTGNTSSDINVLLKEADDKLYNGKQGGRNRVIS